MHITKLSDVTLPGENVAERWYGFKPCATLFADLHESLHLFPGGGRNSDENFVHGVRCEQSWKLIDTSDYWNPLEFDSQFRFVIVDTTRDLVNILQSFEFPYDHLCGGPCPDEDYLAPGCRDFRHRFGQEPREQSNTSQQTYTENRFENVDRPRECNNAKK